MGDTEVVRAWVVRHPGPIGSGPLASVDRPVPVPAAGEVRVRVAVCGVCGTDLHLAKATHFRTALTWCPVTRSSGSLTRWAPEALRAG